QNSQKVFLDTAIGDSAHGPEQNQVIGRYNSLQDLGAALGPLVGYGVGAILGFESVYVAAALALFCLGVFAFPHLRAVKGGELSN
ncbi:MAG: MFS transporter, partial [Firmicutes bacterium]|nr:MFS transporter [Bacillota bacterium]